MRASGKDSTSTIWDRSPRKNPSLSSNDLACTGRMDRLLTSRSVSIHSFTSDLSDLEPWSGNSEVGHLIRISDEWRKKEKTIGLNNLMWENWKEFRRGLLESRLPPMIPSIQSQGTKDLKHFWPRDGSVGLTFRPRLDAFIVESNLDDLQPVQLSQVSTVTSLDPKLESSSRSSKISSLAIIESSLYRIWNMRP